MEGGFNGCSSSSGDPARLQHEAGREPCSSPRSAGRMTLRGQGDWRENMPQGRKSRDRGHSREKVQGVNGKM